MFTSFMQPKYQDNKNDDKKYENSSKCFPNHLITLAAFSFCKEDQEWKVKSKNADNIKEYSGVTLLLLLSINGCRSWQEHQNINNLFTKKVSTTNMSIEILKTAEVTNPQI